MVVLLEDVVTHHPAEGASDEDVGGEVLLPEDASEADAGGKRVDANLYQPGGILVGKDSSRRPYK